MAWGLFGSVAGVFGSESQQGPLPHNKRTPVTALSRPPGSWGPEPSVHPGPLGSQRSRESRNALAGPASDPGRRWPPLQAGLGVATALPRAPEAGLERRRRPGRPLPLGALRAPHDPAGTGRAARPMQSPGRQRQVGQRQVGRLLGPAQRGPGCSRAHSALSIAALAPRTHGERWGREVGGD